eukprot:g4677.t1
MKDISTRTPEQRCILLRRCISTLAYYKDESVFSSGSQSTAGESSTSKKVKIDAVEALSNIDMFGFLANKEDQKTFLEFAQWTLLFQMDKLLPANVELPGKDHQPLELSSTAAATLKPVPPGMSLKQANFIKGKKAPVNQQLIQQKIGLLKYLKDAELPSEDEFLLYLIASADPVEDVNKFGESVLRKQFRIEQDSKDIDLNSPSLISSIMKQLQGSNLGASDPEQLLTEQRISDFQLPASHFLKSKLIGVLSKSLEAANRFPLNIDIVLNCVFANNIPMRIRQQAMEFSVWIVKHANNDILAQLANPMLHELLNLLTTRDLGPEQRGYAYEAIGQLAQRIPSAFAENVQIAEDLFEALESESAGVRSQLQSAVACLAYAFKKMDNQTEDSIKRLLMKSIQNKHSIVRLASITWCIKLFPFSDCFARYICVLGAGDDRGEVSTEATLGLSPVSFSKETKQELSQSFPEIAAFLAFMREHTDWFAKQKHGEILPKVYENMIMFLGKCNGIPELDSSSLDQLLAVFEGALMKGNPDSLLISALESIVSLLGSHFNAISNSYKSKVPMLMEWNFHTNSSVRECSARLTGVASKHLSEANKLQLMSAFVEKLNSKSKSRFEEKDGTMYALGHIAAFAEEDEIQKFMYKETLTNIHLILTGPDIDLASTAAMSIGLQSLKKSFFSGLERHCQDENICVNFTKWFQEDICEKILALCRIDKVPVASKSAMAIGFICKSLHHDYLEAEQYALNGLISLQTIKNEEIQWAVGETLALGLAKQSISNDLLLKTNFTCLRNATLEFQELEPHQADSIADIHGKVLESLIEGLTHARIENRRSCVGYLVSLMTYCPKHPQILQRLEQFQSALLGLLGDKDDITQEMASRGVSLIYSLGDESTKQTLLNGLTSVLSDPSKQGTKVKVEQDTKLFEEGQFGQVPGGGNLTTYRELCSLANDMGQPGLLYKFMDLANHQAALNSRRGAAVGFSHIVKLTAKEDLEPFMKSVLPRIYRLQFYPNARVQESMQNIWKSLVTDQNSTILENFDSIISELLSEMVSRLWRNRESSCRGLVDILQGRKWQQISKYFEQLWTYSFQIMQDIRQSVSTAAITLIKTLKRITLKFIDATYADSKSDINDALNAALPVLLETGLNSSVCEICCLTLSTLSEIASTCPPELLKGYLSSLVPPLLESLSGMENQQLNYIEQHAAASGVNMDRLESLRISASSQSPIGNVLDRCVKIIDKDVFENSDLLQKLKDLVRNGVGLNTKVGTLRFISQMTIQNGPSLSPYAHGLLSVLISKSLSGESSSAIKKALSQTIGAISKFADSKSTTKLVSNCMNAFKTKEDVDQHMIGLIFKELQAQAPHCISDHASTIIPVAFITRFDQKKSVASVWSSVLEEGMGTEAGVIRLYTKEIVQEVQADLTSTFWSLKISASQAIIRLYEVDADRVKEYSSELVEMLLEQVKGQLWAGKEILLTALSIICQKSGEILGELVVPILETFQNASMKEKKEYRNTSIECLADVLKTLPYVAERYLSVTRFLTETTKKQLEVDLLSEAEKEKLDEVQNLSLSTLLQCVANANANVELGDEQKALFQESLDLFCQVLLNLYPWTVKKAALNSLQDMVKPLLSLKERAIDIIEQIYQGAFICLSDQKYLDLRLAALDTMKHLINSPYQNKEFVIESLESVLKSEKSFQIRSKIENLIETLKKL